MPASELAILEDAVPDTLRAPPSTTQSRAELDLVLDALGADEVSVPGWRGRF